MTEAVECGRRGGGGTSVPGVISGQALSVTSYGSQSALHAALLSWSRSDRSRPARRPSV